MMALFCVLKVYRKRLMFIVIVLCFLLHVALPPPQPKFTSLLDDVTVREGKPAQFQCHVSPPDADVTWFLHGEEIQDGDERYVIEVEDDARRLVILLTSRADHGDVTASLGDDEESIAQLTVEGEEVLGTF